MKKPNLVIGKNHIILACLTLMLGIAIYLNFVFGQGKIEHTNEVDNTADVAGNYGDVELVNQEDSTDYFAAARLDRMEKRDLKVEALQTMLSGGDITEEEKAVIAAEALNASKLIECEGVVESLIKAQGFEDCVVYLDGQSADIVVKTDGLIPTEAAQIKDILLSKVSVANENIKITEVK